MSVVVSLVLEPDLTIHMGLGLVFVGLVVTHLAQRRKVSAGLLRQLTKLRVPPGKGGRLALTDLFLVLLTAAMLGSGLWDWLAGEPTRIRWHAISGVVLAGFLAVHTLRRRRRVLHTNVR